MSDLAEKILGFFSAEDRAKPPSRKEMYKFTIDAAEVIAEQLRELKLRIDEIEANGARFRGIYQRASSYRRGDQATHRGSLWTALGDVPEGTVPGENPTLWQLSAKGTG